MREFNILLLGAVGSGKSALTVKYLTKRFIGEYDPEIEDTYNTRSRVDGVDCVINIRDTYNENEQCPQQHVRWAHAVLVVYSIVEKHTFTTAKDYLSAIQHTHRQHSKTKALMLLGNQLDLERYRAVPRSSGQALASTFDCSFHEVSAAEDFESIRAIFSEAVREILRLDDQGNLPALYITEDRTSTNSPTTPGSNPSATRVRTKSVAERKEFNKKAAPGFKLFNKGFKIFN